MTTKHLLARASVAATLALAIIGVSALHAEAVPPYGAVISDQQMELLAADGASVDRFGRAVAISADTAVIGAEGDDGTAGSDQGSAYVYARVGSSWVQQQKLVASDAAAADQFGTSVSVSGDTVVIGSSGDDGPAGSNLGSAYVFSRAGTTWSEQQKLTALEPDSGDRFGASVAVSGDNVVVGAPFDDGPAGPFQGSAAVFSRTGTTWTHRALLIPSDATDRDQFGHAVAISGETALVGAPAAEAGGAFSRGSAYVFVRAFDEWTEQDRLTAGDAADGDNFGYSVAISADTALVGAPYDAGSGNSQGAGYVFSRGGTSWTEQQKLLPGDGADGDAFGFSVGLSGDNAVIGAPDAAGAAGAFQGKAYVFTRSGAVWSQHSKLLAADAAASDQFGSVAISGDTAIVGAFFGDGAVGSNQGSAYVFVPGSFSVADTSVTEGSGAARNATFTITRSGTTAHPAYVNVHTAAGTATSGADFVSGTTTVSFNPGVAARTFSVAVTGDALDENDETFEAVLTSPVGALIDDGAATATIVDDDDGSTLSIAAPAAVTETDDTPVAATFSVTRTGGSGGPVSVEVHTSDGTAKAADDDYTPAARTLRWADGETGSKNFTVMVEPDNLTEATERFFARLSRASGADIVTGFARATINDDDVAAGPSLAINDPTILEANSGTKNIVFRVTRTGSTANAITFSFATANGTAIAPGDYTAKTGTVTIPAGASSVTVGVTTRGDVTKEPNETFTLTISNASGGATIGKAVGTGTISNND